MTDFYYDTTYTYGMRKESITEDEYESSDCVSDDEYSVVDDLSQKFEHGMKRFTNGMSSVHDELSDI